MNLSKNISSCIWFTGLSGSGKSTLSGMLKEQFDQMDISAIILDGDLLRQGLNKGLGFTEADREENIRRVAEVTKLILGSGVHVICAFISPTHRIRELARNIIGKRYFFEVYVSTPLETCINRDPKGLYSKALKGEIENFTGIDSPYEAPLAPDLTICTDNLSPALCTDMILKKLGIAQQLESHTLGTTRLIQDKISNEK